MEPITLCGVVIVIAGFWVHYEVPMKRVVRLICGSRTLKGVRELARADQQPAYARRLARTGRAAA